MPFNRTLAIIYPAAGDGILREDYMITELYIDDIRVEPEHGHWKLSQDGFTMRCYAGELNTAIPKFKNWITERKQAAIL